MLQKIHQSQWYVTGHWSVSLWHTRAVHRLRIITVYSIILFVQFVFQFFVRCTISKYFWFHFQWLEVNVNFVPLTCVSVFCIVQLYCCVFNTTIIFVLIVIVVIWSEWFYGVVCGRWIFISCGGGADSSCHGNQSVCVADEILCTWWSCCRCIQPSPHIGGNFN